MNSAIFRSLSGHFGIFGLLFFLPVSLMAQQQHPPQGLKASLSFVFPRNSTNKIDIGKITPTYLRPLKGNVSQLFELSDFRISRTSPNPIPDTVVNSPLFASTYINIGFRYGFLFRLIPESSRIYPFVAIYTEPYYQYQSIDPYSSNYFPTTFFTAGNRFGAMPGIRFHLRNNFFLDLEALVQLFDISFAQNQTDNPALPVRQRSTNTMGWELFPGELQFRFGLGMQLPAGSR